MRPALISRSASLPIASISAGVGGRGGCEDVTIYMKRIKKLLLGREAAVSAAKLSRHRLDDRRSAGSTCVLKKISASIAALRTRALEQRPIDPLRHGPSKRLHPSS